MTQQRLRYNDSTSTIVVSDIRRSDTMEGVDIGHAIE